MYLVGIHMKSLTYLIFSNSPVKVGEGVSNDEFLKKQ
jgi:hypothetical protein